MKLRSGAEVTHLDTGRIAHNPKRVCSIAEHNASSPLLKLPQEIKNRIYYFVSGGQTVHILQNDRNHEHAHGDETIKLSHTTCLEHIPEQQVQRDFDSADPDNVWNIAALKNRHSDCHKPLPKQKPGSPEPNQLSLTFLRSCRQVYLEAKMVHYATNTFAIDCNDILERFVRARFQNKQNLAIRSLLLGIGVTHASNVEAWSESINKAVLKRLKSVRHLHLSLQQLYCSCCVEICGYEGTVMTARQGKMFKEFCKLPLKEVTLVVNDHKFLQSEEPHYLWHYYDQMEQSFRWTMKQKQDFSKDVRDVLLGRGEEK